MARSSLFRALRRALRKNKPAPDPAAAWTRRDVLATFGAAALVPVIGGCGDNASDVKAPPIAIIGGGIAGLTAAHFLRQAGVRAEVFEANMRVGGRMFTQRGLAGDQLIELGGELVDSNHLVIPALARTFGFTLDDLVDATPGLAQDQFHFNGNFIPEVTLVNQFTPVAAKMQENIIASDGEDQPALDEFNRIDALSIPDWLTMEAGLAPNSLIKEILELSYREEYGLEVAEQSAWNMLFLIDSEVPDPFRIFGDSDERFHIHQGNDSIPTAIADEIGDQVHLDHKLTSVAADGDEFVLTFSTSGGDVTFRAAHVVYALPFSVLREVDLTGAGLSADKLEVITEEGYGTNAKLMLQFSERSWETNDMSSGSVITDVGEVQTLWSTSRGQAGDQGILTNFVGGARGLAIGDGTAESQAQAVLPGIDTIYPGTAATYIPNSAVRQHWPTVPTVKGSYACYKVGQWRFFGTEGLQEGNQHFCGEHCSEDFQGYMEGGAETGALAAAEVLDDLEISLPTVLAGIVSTLTGDQKRARASYHRGTGSVAAKRAGKTRRMKLREIRRR